MSHQYPASFFHPVPCPLLLNAQTGTLPKHLLSEALDDRPQCGQQRTYSFKCPWDHWVSPELDVSLIQKKCWCPLHVGCSIGTWDGGTSTLHSTPDRLCTAEADMSVLQKYSLHWDAGPTSAGLQRGPRLPGPRVVILMGGQT
jgi:hypothetical protein